MANILQAAKLDFYSSARSMSLLFVIFFVFNIIMSGVIATACMNALLLGMLFTAVVSGNVFGIFERAHGNKLYGVLPVRRHDVVAGRYIYGLGLGLVNLVLSYPFLFNYWPYVRLFGRYFQVFQSPYFALMILAVILIGLALLAASAVISSAIYKRKEL